MREFLILMKENPQSSDKDNSIIHSVLPIIYCVFIVLSLIQKVDVNIFLSYRRARH